MGQEVDVRIQSVDTEGLGPRFSGILDSGFRGSGFRVWGFRVEGEIERFWNCQVASPRYLAPVE